MYICQLCSRNIGPGIPQIKKVAEKRKKTYLREDSNLAVGWEIVKEIAICPACAK